MGTVDHWGDERTLPETEKLLNEVKFLMDNKKSFNLYVLHGGTSFGFTAGASLSDKDVYQPFVTSYDFNAPVNEQGHPTQKYMALRNLIGSYLPKKQKLPDIPVSKPAVEIPSLFPMRFTSIWDYLPDPLTSDTLLSFEESDQFYGFMLYQTRISDYSKGLLKVEGLNDCATVFFNGDYIGRLSRMEGLDTIRLPETNIQAPELEILVEAMGRISKGENMTDRKGITGNVTLNGISLKNWNIYNLPVDKKFIYDLRSKVKVINKPGIFYKGNVSLGITGDTYFDLTGYTKGIVWINGNNIGRYWNIGPQRKLFCPESFLRLGINEILILDLVQIEPKPVLGSDSP
jgi:beta-galactosidase